MDDPAAVLLDVSVVHPAAKSHLRAAQHPLGAALRRERLKSQKYDALATSEGAHFSPFVVESYGAMSKSALTVVDWFACQARQQNSNITRKFLVEAISVCLMRGNARIAIEGAHLTARNTRPPFNALQINAPF